MENDWIDFLIFLPILQAVDFVVRLRDGKNMSLRSIESKVVIPLSTTYFGYSNVKETKTTVKYTYLIVNIQAFCTKSSKQ